MLCLNEYLKSASKKHLATLNHLLFKSKGIIKGQVVFQNILNWARDKQRLKSLLATLSPEAIDLLTLIYCGENFGLKETDFMALQKIHPLENLLSARQKLLKELLIYEVKADNSVYYGFDDLFDLIYETLISKSFCPVKGNATWSSYKHFLYAHFLHLMSQIQKGAVKFSSNGEINRRSEILLQERFSFGQSYSISIPNIELNLLLQFLSDRGFIKLNEKTVFLSPDGDLFTRQKKWQIEQEIFIWWYNNRMMSKSRLIKKTATLFPEGLNVEPLHNILNLFSRNQNQLSILDNKKKPALTWDQLSSALQELWLLGLAQFDFQKGKIQSVRLQTLPDIENIKNDLSGSEVSTAIFTPNFEVLIPVDLENPWHYMLELALDKIGDDHISTYRISKESLIMGLKSGLNINDFISLINLTSGGKTLSREIKEWAACYTMCCFKTRLILSIKDKNRIIELAQLPQISSLVDEIIPQYGFIISAHNKLRVLEVLQQFGLIPQDEDIQNRDLCTPLTQPTNLIDFKSRPGGNTVFKGLNAYTSHVSIAGSRYSASGQTPTLTEKLRLLEYAILDEKNVEMCYANEKRRRVIFRPIHLLKNQVPVKAIGTEVATGFRDEFSINDVTSIRIIG